MEITPEAQIMSGETPSSVSHTPSNDPYTVGSEVIYGLNGKCQIIGKETKTIAGESIEFFKLQTVKAQLSRSKKVEPYIWTPVSQAKRLGLRPVITTAQIDQVLEIIDSIEIYFSVDEPFRLVSKKLEKCIFAEGAFGLAKVVSFFEGYRIKHPILNPEVNRFDQMVCRLLTREMAEVLDESIKSQEDRIKKGLKNKELPIPEEKEEKK